jgi:hypothetical protein
MSGNRLRGKKEKGVVNSGVVAKSVCSVDFEIVPHADAADGYPQQHGTIDPVAFERQSPSDRSPHDREPKTETQGELSKKNRRISEG